MIRDVTDLAVYKLSLELVGSSYTLTRQLPKSELSSVSQINRASKSIVANIAEGFAKRQSEKEFKRFLKIALGSSDEVVTHLRTMYLVLPRFRSEIEILSNIYKTLSKRIHKLQSIWKSDNF